MTRTQPFVAIFSLGILVAGCGPQTDSTPAESSSESAALTSSSVVGTFALTGENHLPYTSFQLINSKIQPHTYFATGICPTVSWGFDCSQAPSYNGSWKLAGDDITFTGDIEDTFTLAVTSTRIHLTDKDGNESAYKRESTDGHFKPGADCGDIYGNPLGECDGGDSFGCSWLGPGSNEMVCSPDW